MTPLHLVEADPKSDVVLVLDRRHTNALERILTWAVDNYEVDRHEFEEILRTINAGGEAVSEPTAPWAR